MTVAPDVRAAGEGDGTEATLLRATALVTAGNAVSRITGFVRVLAIGFALGTTFLGNTYQSSNLVSNILFELLAAGLLSSVLVPTFVGLLDEDRADEAAHVAGALLGICLVALGGVTALALAAAPWLMRLLTIAVTNHHVRQDEVRVGTFFLWFFLPQVLLYAVGAVATALLHGARRFNPPAFAPVANNLVVTATMAAFWVMRHGHHAATRPGLDVPVSQRLVLAVGTTIGVLCMTLVPVVSAWRSGFRLRPRWDLRHPRVRGLGRAGAWAAAYLALNQLLVGLTLVLANRVEGGVVAYQIAYTFFLLPHALLANPVTTTLYPKLASDAAAARWRAFSDGVARGNRLLAFLVLPASALLVALARPTLQLVRLGALDRGGASLVARVLAAYAVGLIGYSAFQLLTRASYAAGDTRTPTLVNLGLTVGGAALMVVWFVGARGADRVVVLGFATSIAGVAGAIALGMVLRRARHEHAPVLAALVRSAACAVASGVVARVVADAVGGGAGRPAAAFALLAGALPAIAVYVLTQWALRAPELRRPVPA